MERVLKTVRKEKTDYLPVDFSFSNKRIEGEYAAKLNITDEAFKEYLGSDIVYLPILDDLSFFIDNEELIEYALKNGFASRDETGGILFDRWGVGWAKESEGVRPMIHPLDTPEKALKYEAPDPFKEGLFHAVEKDIKKFQSEGYAIIIPQYIGLLERAWVLTGFERFFIDCIENPDYIKVLLDKITDYRVEVAKKIVEHGATFGHIGDDYGTQYGPIMSVKLWRELFKPRLARIWDVYKKKNIPVIHHSCGDCRLFIDDLIEIGMDVLHPVQPTAMPLEELKEKYGDRITFYGGIDTRDILPHGSAVDVEEDVKRAARILGKDGGLILSALNIMSDVPEENIEMLVKCVKNYRDLKNIEKCL